MAVVGTASRNIIIYHLENVPREYKQMESPLKYQHRCVAIFRDKKNVPTGKHDQHFLSCWYQKKDLIF